jgi:hypothetical protein
MSASGRNPSRFDASLVDSDAPTFRTVNSGFAAAALTADLMSYIDAEPSENGRDVVFILSDPETRGPELLREFTAGIFTRVHPRLFLEVKGFLQGEVRRIKNNEGASDDKD